MFSCSPTWCRLFSAWHLRRLKNQCMATDNKWTVSFGIVFQIQMFCESFRNIDIVLFKKISIFGRNDDLNVFGDIWINAVRRNADDHQIILVRICHHKDILLHVSIYTFFLHSAVSDDLIRFAHNGYFSILESILSKSKKNPFCLKSFADLSKNVPRVKRAWHDFRKIYINHFIIRPVSFPVCLPHRKIN